jgi:hypothetical protein
MSRQRGFCAAGEQEVLKILARHVGAHQAIGAGELFLAATGKEAEHKINDTRDLRFTIAKLRREGWPICSASARGREGYYLALDGEDLERFCRRLEARGLKSLIQAAALRRLGLPELLGQLALSEQSAVSG